jgi:predicted O-methyltransferase YrrM
MTDQLYSYLLDNSLREPEILVALRGEIAGHEWERMRIAPEQGQFFSLLLKIIGAKQVLELGTYMGYGTLWMALAIPASGRVVTVDIEPEWTSVAREYWQKAGVEQRIEQHLGLALEVLDELLESGEAGKFDFAFLDADKLNYEAYFERALQLIRPGGVIAVDNVLWSGSVANPAIQEKNTRIIRAFNANRHHDERVHLSMVPIGDGVTLAMKLNDGV